MIIILYTCIVIVIIITVIIGNYYHYAMIIVNTYIGAIALTNEPFSEAVAPLLIRDIGCVGAEPSVLQCPHNTMPGSDCGQFDDAGAVCQGVWHSHNSTATYILHT